MTPEEKHKQRGYKFARLSFYSFTIAFYAILFQGVTAELVELYLYYCLFSGVALGVFAAKDVLNQRAFLSKNGNGSSPEGGGEKANG